MKSLFTKMYAFVLALAIAGTVCAQITPPAGLTGQALRDWFKQNYYNGKHQQLGYTNARVKMYNFIDNQNNSLKCVYSGLVVSWTYGGTGSNPAPLNCEHTIPQSFFAEGEPMKSDIHHLFPTYANWNSTRSNHPFKDIADASTEKWMRSTTTQTTIPTSTINEWSEYANSSFEPREDHKGNVARSIFYFYNMYPTQAGPMSKVGDINMFYQWHLADPVDAAEIARNNKVEQYQGDRNPYIDFPQLVDEAWGLSGGTTPPPVVTVPSTISYCTAKGNSVADEWIASVAIGSFTKTSGTNGGYADFTANTVTLAQGSSNALTLTPGYTGSAYPEYFRIWIDLNKDKDFSDAGELVFDGGSAANGVKTGTLAISASASTGTTRMRVAMRYNAAPVNCEAFDYGEIEDYTVNITTGSTTPPPVVVPPTVTYCASKGNSVADEWINKVTLGTINNTSGANAGYKDYSNLSTNLTKGVSSTITIFPAWSGSVYSEGYAVWIDFNKDGDFTDAGEQVFSKAPAAATSASGSFTVPSAATNGTTRMRVAMKYNGIPTACEAFGYGEVEDYTVNITSAARIGIEESVEASFEVFPNPASSILTIRGNAGSEMKVKMYAINGAELVNTIANDEYKLNVENFEAGLYMLLLESEGISRREKLIIVK
ncbi:MAG: GEVED domain-containing protein [Cytophagales bacterium]